MLAYLKLKTNNEELYESNYLIQLKEKTNVISKIQYIICYLYYQLVVWLKYYTNTITVKEIYGGYLFIFPFDTVNNKKIKICMKKTKNLIQKYKINSLVLTEELNKYQGFKQEIQKVHILDGRGIMPYLIKEIIEYITKLQKTNLAEEDLYICANKNKPICTENISYLMYYFKSINIVTKSINTFQKMADKIAEKENIIITVTNNKKKSLRKAKIIINFDFENSEIQKYNIYRKAILISINKQEPYENIGFDGIQIRQIGIDTSQEIKEFFEKYNLINNCSLSALYESLINEKQEFLAVKEKMQKDNVKVIKLYGKNGEISKKECAYL
ncbi:MAG: hypothetical protein ACI4UU_04580 [Clostridia bacterium]